MKPTHRAIAPLARFTTQGRRTLLHLAQVLAISCLAAPAPAFETPKAFAVEVPGSGRAMILLPGLAASGDVWQGTVAHNAGRFQCHVLTLAGFAGQPPIPPPLLPAVETQMRSYIAAHHLHKPILVGHGMGGLLAPGPEQYEKNQRATALTMASLPADQMRILQWSMGSDRGSVAQAMYEIMTTDLRADLARIRSPVLVLGTNTLQSSIRHGFVGRLFGEPGVDAIFRLQYNRLAGVQVEMAERSKHFLIYDDPTWMFSRIYAFLK